MFEVNVRTVKSYMMTFSHDDAWRLLTAVRREIGEARLRFYDDNRMDSFKDLERNLSKELGVASSEEKIEGCAKERRW